MLPYSSPEVPVHRVSFRVMVRVNILKVTIFILTL